MTVRSGGLQETQADGGDPKDAQATDRTAAATAPSRPGDTRQGRGPAAQGGPGSTRRKEQVLTRHSPSHVESIADAVVIKAGEPFFICPPDGQIPVDGAHGFGLYHHDTRFLGGFELDFGGIRPSPLAATSVTGTRMLLELTTPELHLPGGKVVGKERLGIQWERDLSMDGPRLTDRITVRNFGSESIEVPLEWRFSAGFEDLFMVRGLLDERPGTLHDPRWDHDELVFRYDGRDGVTRTIRIGTNARIARRHSAGFGLGLAVPARGSGDVEVHVELGEDVHPGAKPIERRTRQAASEQRGTRQKDSETQPSGDAAGVTDSGAGGPGWPVKVTTDSIALNAVLARSLDDLQTLRGELDGQRYYAAGVPWFSTLFGRDALITGYETVAFEPAVVAETLRLLAGRQGTKDDPWRDEQPGKILHELRIGELARLDEIPHTPYYGTVDATPLFLCVLAEHGRWTGSLDLFHELRSNVDRALGWIDGPGGASGGYLSYDSTDHTGLVNQGWKDSGDAIVRSDGSLAEPPIALAEVQGYVYRAKRGMANLFERDGDQERADRLRREAADLQARFEQDFWSDELGCYALALEKGNRRLEVATSNAGQVLWSSIQSPGRARSVAERLMGDDLFDGWGVRTLSSREQAYNPIGYHLGTVWPHDNALIAEGFRRAGLDEPSERLFTALVEASTQYAQHRLPECMAGFSRSSFGVPVRYPIACHPQAWAAAAIPNLLVTTLGLVPDAFEHQLRIVRPSLPRFVSRVAFHDLAIGDARVDVAFERERGRTRVETRRKDGDLEISVEAA